MSLQKIRSLWLIWKDIGIQEKYEKGRIKVPEMKAL